MRITPSGFDFVADNIEPIIAGATGGGGLDFCLPKNTDSSPNVCYQGEMCDGIEGCPLSLSIDDAAIEPSPPDTLNLAVTIGDLDETISIRAGSNCLITFEGRTDDTQPAQIGATIPITFAVDQSTPFNDVRIEFGDLTMQTDELGYDIDGFGILDIPVCESLDFLAGIDLVRDALLPLLQDQFEPLIRDTIDEQLCVSCDGGCPGASSCDTDLNVCRYQDDTCPQNTLGVAGQLDLGTLLADYTEEPDAAVDLTVRAADHAVVDDGVTLGLRSGYDPESSSICVPADPTVRDFTAPQISPTVSGNTRPNGDPFHFGLSYHEKALESMLWSVWGSGATCMRIGSEAIDLVSTGAFGALLPSVKDLTYGRSQAAYVKIVPQTQPEVILGANTVMEDGNSYTIEDPLMTIDWKDFDVHIYGFAQSRFTRLLTIRLDLALPIAVVADGMGGILPVLGDFEEAIGNERILQAGLIAEDPDRILDLLPTLIGFALPALADSLSDPIEIPEFFGFRIDIGPGDITSVDNNTSIAIFADLEVVQMPLTLRSDTTILDSSVDVSRTTPSGLVRPEVTLDVMPLTATLQSDTTGREVEYSYRVDGSTWSLFHRTNRLEIDHPLLVVPGEHTIEVRSRYVGSPYTVDPTPATAKVIVDWEKPDVEIRRDGNTVTFDATDVVDEAADLQYRYRIVTGESPASWTAWTQRSTLELNERPADRFRIEVEARDRSGNVGTDTQTVTWTAALEREAIPPTTPDAEPAPRAGCDAAGGDGPAGAIWLLLVGGGLVLLRRCRRPSSRTRLKALGLAAILSVGACKCGDDTGGENECDPACEAGEQCVDGECQATIECSTDEDCENSEQCVSGECVPAPSCEEKCDCGSGEYAKCGDDGSCNCLPYCDKGCGDGEYCCYDSNSCETLPDPCADQMCEPGFGPVVQSDASGDNESCEIDGGECACEKLPPLPLGWHGHYAALDRNAGVTALATYNSTYGDLMVGILDANLDPTWYWVDGVPDEGDIEGALDGPRGGIADGGDDVGSHTALAIDDAGNLHVFYRNEDDGTLNYAVGTDDGGGYSFTTSEIDADGDTGYWASAVHLDGTIHLVYATRAVDAGGTFETQLRHLSFDATGTPDDPTATRETLATDDSANPCGFECERRERCVASVGQCQEPTSDCSSDCADGSVCYMGTCELEYEAPPAAYLEAVGTNAELSTTPDGGLLLVYWDGMQESVVWQRWNDGWGTANVLGTGTGPWASGAVDSDDAVHLAYMQTNTVPPELVYRNATADVTETVQDGIRDTADWWLVNDIGEDVDLRIGDDGTVTVVYQDATSHALKLATRDGADSWTVSDLSVPGDPYTGSHGFYATMLKLGDTQLSVDMVINQSLDPTEATPASHE